MKASLSKGFRCAVKPKSSETRKEGYSYDAKISVREDLRGALTVSIALQIKPS